MVIMKFGCTSLAHERYFGSGVSAHGVNGMVRMGVAV